MKNNSSFNAGYQINAEIIEQVDIIARMLAPEYDASETYELGSSVRYDGSLYVCVQAIDEPEEWTPAHWQKAVVATTPDDSGEDLPPADLVWFGYYFAGAFWKQKEHLDRLPNRPERIYVDVPSSGLYVYSSRNEEYVRLVPLASPSVPGVSKLYDSLGDNTDGSIAQNVITDELSRKVEMDVSHLQSDERLDLFFKS